MTIKQPTIKEATDHLKKHGGHFEGKRGSVKWVQDEKQEDPTAEELIFECSKKPREGPKPGYCECGKFIEKIRGNFMDEKGMYEKGKCIGCGEIKKRRLE